MTKPDPSIPPELSQQKASRDAGDATVHNNCLSIRDLNNEEIDYVIRTFARRVGLDSALSRKEDWDVISVEELVEALAINEWPDVHASATELLWCSEPLQSERYSRLNKHSVFWQRTKMDFRLWIGSRPHIPANKENIVGSKELLNRVVILYKVYITDEHRHDHQVAIKKWKLKRLTTSTILNVIGVITIATYCWIRWGPDTGEFIKNLLLGLASYTIVSTAGRSFVRRFGYLLISFATMLVLLFAAYIIILVSIRLGEVNISPSDTDAIAFGLSWILGQIVSELKYPKMTLGDILRAGGLRGFYKVTIATTALVIVPTYGALKVIEHIIRIFTIESSMSLFLIPVSGMVVIALYEFIRRELARNEVI